MGLVSFCDLPFAGFVGEIEEPIYYDQVKSLGKIRCHPCKRKIARLLQLEWDRFRSRKKGKAKYYQFVAGAGERGVQFLLHWVRIRLSVGKYPRTDVPLHSAGVSRRSQREQSLRFSLLSRRRPRFEASTRPR